MLRSAFTNMSRNVTAGKIRSAAMGTVAATPIYDFEVKDVRGKLIDMERYKNKVVLIVNTATKCGFTPQLHGLEALYKKHKDAGFEVIGFPCNQFMGQEPNVGEALEQVCKRDYGVTFQITERIDVNGEHAHPLYAYLKKEAPGLMGLEAIKWNFEKFLVNRNGKVKDVRGKLIDMERYKNKVVLIVNTATKCGLTPQLHGLEALYKKHKDAGFEVIGFPCNQFMGQEPNVGEALEQVCQRNFGVTFQITERIDVNGENAHPLYAYIKKEAPGILGFEAIKWNFEKFLVNRHGKIVKRFSPQTTPEAIEGEIATLLGEN
eukprot:jgi/Hompol1/5078/HPOL_001300-RA